MTDHQILNVCSCAAVLLQIELMPLRSSAVTPQCNVRLAFSRSRSTQKRLADT